MRLLFLVFALGIQVAVSQAQLNGQSALIIVDMQEEFTKDTKDSAAFGGLINGINDLITAARPMTIIFIKANIKVLNISLRGIKVETSKNNDLDSRLYRKKNDLVFMKEESNAFSVDELSKVLETNHIEQLYLSGIYLGECLSSTALDGIVRGYKVTVVREGVKAKKDSKTEKLLNELSQAGVELISLDEFRLKCHEEAVQ